MNRHITPIDISSLPDLLRIAEKVKTTKKPRILTRASEIVAILMPAGTALPYKAKGIWAHYDPKCVRAALKHSAGALQGVNLQELLSNLAATPPGKHRPLLLAYALSC